MVSCFGLLFLPVDASLELRYEVRDALLNILFMSLCVRRCKLSTEVQRVLSEIHFETGHVLLKLFLCLECVFSLSG